ERDGLHAHLHHLVDEGHQQHEPGPVPLAARIENGLGAAAKPEDDRPLVLAQDAREGADEEERRDGDDDEQERFHVDHATPPLTCAFAASASALQISPATSTWPSGARRSRTVAYLPTSPSGPVDDGRPSARTPAAITKRKSPAVAATVGPITHQE